MAGAGNGLKTILTLVAVVEAAYAATALLTPPAMVTAVTGWVLSPDGHWLVKLLGAALAFQAVVAWTLRRTPVAGLIWALAAYQIGAATIDWVMWLVLADQGVFSTTLARLTVGFSVVLHYGLGAALILAMRKETAG